MVTFLRRRYGTDNYLYVLAEGDDAALVDPGDAEVALQVLRENGLKPQWILHTHGHADHTGGSARLRKALGAMVLGHGADADRFRPDSNVEGSSELALGKLRVRVHAAPGHTPGSVLYEWAGRLFTGDTLFWGGCGNCRHGGEPGQLADSFLGTIASLDASLKVHPGHDYAEANLRFVLDLEPDNRAARERLAAVRAARSSGLEPEADDLAEERVVNPFLRAGSPEVLEALMRRGLSPQDPKAAFLSLRRLRDRW
jgi:hydroxyacylglutathione hydrolase